MKRVSLVAGNRAQPRKAGSYSDRIVQRLGDRRITLYRRTDIDDSSWFFCVYLREEKRQYRISLKTTDRQQAKRKAEDVLIELLGRIRGGEKILSPSLGDVLRDYRKEQERLVAEGQIAKNTVRLQAYRINLGVEFLATLYSAGQSTKITVIDGEVFNGYLAWRRAKRASKGPDMTIRLDVVRDELLCIRKVFHYAHDQKLCSERSIPTWNFKVEKEGPKRRRVTKDHYTAFLNCIKKWKGTADSPKEKYHREMLFHFILVVSNTGLRTGELLGLKNRDVEIREQANECVITVRPETSKVRRGRHITVNQSFGGHPTRTKGINYLIRWLEKFQIHKDRNDYVFSPHDDGGKLARDVYYHSYKKLRVDLKEIELDWFDTYHCRHFWITNRLYAGEPIHLVARAAGTSTDEIEKTYSHVLSELTTRQFGRNRVVYGRDGSYGVVSGNPGVPQSGSEPASNREVDGGS
jgi:integrase